MDNSTEPAAANLINQKQFTSRCGLTEPLAGERNTGIQQPSKSDSIEIVDGDGNMSSLSIAKGKSGTNTSASGGQVLDRIACTNDDQNVHETYQNQE